MHETRPSSGCLFYFQAILNIVVSDDSSSNLFRPQLSPSAQDSREPREVTSVEGKHIVNDGSVILHPFFDDTMILGLLNRLL